MSHPSSAATMPDRSSAGSEVKSPDPPAVRRRPNAYLAVGAVASLAVAVFAVRFWMGASKESTDDAQVDADVVAVAARVGGSVLKVHVTDNQRIKKGELLVEIDPADLTVKEKQAEADLAAARAQAEAAEAQVHIVEATSRGGLSAARAQVSGSASSVASADADVEAAKAALARAQAEAGQADTDMSRAEALRTDEAVPQSQVDTARSNALAAHAAVAQAKAQLAAAQETRRTAQARIAEAQGRVEQSAPVDALLAAARANADVERAKAAAAEAALAQAKLQLSYTRIEAPTDGALSRLAVHEGQLLQTGQQVVVIVPSTTYVIANFKETQVGRMHAGQRADVSLDAFPGRSFAGRIDSMSPGTGARFSLLPPDNASGNFIKVVQRVPVKIAWVDLPSGIDSAAGMSANVTVSVDR